MRHNIVYIVGAGFSAPLGLPVISTFLSRSKDLFAEDPERFSHFQAVFAEINRMSQAKNYLSIDLFDIEQILSILDMEDYAADTEHRGVFRQYLADTVSALTPQVTRHPNMPGNWQDWLFTDHDVMRGYCNWLAGLFGVAVRTTNATGEYDWAGPPDPPADYGIISLNYDMVLESCLALINGQVTPKGQLTFRGTIDGEGLPLAKIHGSVEPMTIVPPTWQKLAGEEVRDAWRLAVHLLSEANEIRFLGFSFPETDGYVKYLLSLGAMRAPHLKAMDVVCLDPGGEVEERYSQFISFSGFSFHNLDLAHYFGSFGGRTDEKVLDKWHGHPSVAFHGIDLHHHRALGRTP